MLCRSVAVLLLISSSIQANRLESQSLNIDFTKVKQQTNEVGNLIYQRYQLDRQDDSHKFFLEVSNMPHYAWDIQKYKIAKKIVNPNSSYLMIFGGSSVTAGHDNYYNESYPFVFERRVASIFDSLGIKLIVRNIAQGANNCRPFDYCYESMGGGNADYIGWEQSFNCGKDKGVFELMARLSYWYGAVLCYFASGGWIPNNCPVTKEPIARISELWKPTVSSDMMASANKTDKPMPLLTPESVAARRELMSDWFGDGNSASKFSSIYGGLYKAVGPFGFNFFAHSSTLCHNGTGCDAINVIGSCAAYGGPSWLTKEASYYANDPEKQGRNWHPPTGMHTLRGEVMAYHYVYLLADAAFMVEKDLKNMTTAQASEEYSKVLSQLREPIPSKALYLPAEEGNNVPHCYTNFEPHFNPSQTLEVVMMTNSNYTEWKLVRPQHHIDPSNKYGYKDFKPYYESGKDGTNAPLHLKVMNMRSGFLRVCAYNHKNAFSHAFFDLDPHYHFQSNNSVNNSSSSSADGDDATTTTVAIRTNSITAVANVRNREIYHPTDKIIRLSQPLEVGDDCVKLSGIPAGDHVLSIYSDPKHYTQQHRIKITHIIVF